MNPCPENKQLITWMSAGALEPQRASALEKHFDSCPGCRAYHGQMSELTARLHEECTLPEANLSARFHAGMVRRIAREQQRVSKSGLLADVQSCWRAARSRPAFVA